MEDQVNILLVEDEAPHAALIQRAFRSREGPTHITHVQTLAEARKHLEETSPDLAVIDLRLPDGSGTELLVLKDGAPLFPMVIMTSHGDEQVAVEAMKRGAMDYVVKSEAMLKQMPRIVERVLREWGHIQERRRAEMALRESEVRFRGLFEHAPVATLEADFSAVMPFLKAQVPVGEDLLSFLGNHPAVVEAGAGLVRLLAVNATAVELFEAENVSALRDALPAFFTEGMAEAFARMLAAVALGSVRFELESQVMTLRSNPRYITLRWTVPPGHEQDYSRVLISLVDVTERKRLEKEILEISGREQRRIGRDLHDGLGQLLAGTRFKIARLRQRLLQRGLEEEADTVGEIDQFVAEAMTQARALAQGLNPVSVEADGLVQALRGLVYTVERLAGIPCTLEAQAEAIDIPDPEVATHVYRIAQEALNNAMRHSHARKLTVMLSREGSHAVLQVRDDGVGFPETLEAGSGMGLRIMRYRARLIQGKLEVRRVEEGGTLVTLQFPLHTGQALPALEVPGAALSGE